MLLVEVKFTSPSCPSSGIHDFDVKIDAPRQSWMPEDGHDGSAWSTRKKETRTTDDVASRPGEACGGEGHRR
jgi:hypothetical protein